MPRRRTGDSGVAEDITAEVFRIAWERELDGAETTPGWQEYVLLLERQDDGRFTLVNTVQGAYGVAGSGAVPAEGNEVELSPAVLKALGLGG
ncbi:hypothetical protein [Streptomyces sp. NPDC047999]|uniref:hypothetical protein n=1 Tax=unclassified Streptomyces TaxID=2593676 RepID=UPI00371D3E97